VSGIALARRTNARLLVTTRVMDMRGADTITSDADQRALISLAWDTTAWRVVAPAHTTHDEALRTSELLAPASSRTIAVVTSPLHTRRACATFEHLGFHVVCVPSDERQYPVYAFDSPVARWRALLDYIYERLAILKYRAKHWI
jgi:uncharacterized SAM-binding protein YcdF (DUF218 family)